MEILRIEKDGVGPYRCSNRSMDVLMMCRKHNYDDVVRPSPKDNHECLSSLWSVPETYFFGFMTLEALTKWFDHEDMPVLKEDGYVIAVYEVPEEGVRKGTEYGSGQIAFKRGENKPVFQISL